ncbi:hypothetical protein N0V90_012942 [Kalmusia sp. IMI 367209]|nr:hypothetical protein N0V90_012942 [Kalmusia sp. IMI 367209]
MHVSVIASAALFCANTFAAPLQAGEKGYSVYLTTDEEWGHRETTGLYQNFPILGFGRCWDLQFEVWHVTNALS